MPTKKTDSSTETAAAPEAAKLVEVTLKKTHRHKGRDYPVDAKINVTERQRDWLKSQDVI